VLMAVGFPAKFSRELVNHWRPIHR
jgi:hypothetical protein